MNFTRISTLLLLVLSLAQIHAQKVRGIVYGLNEEERQIRLPGAQLVWLGTTSGSVADEDGIFMIDRPAKFPAFLIAQYAGYANDTLSFDPQGEDRLRFVLRQGVDMKAFEVVEKKQSTILNTRSIINVESLNNKELKRAACCDLSESFESSATVDVSFSDAVTGTKAIKMLGLDGRYAQISMENIPFMRGLSATSGLTFIPGTWLHSINITKGVGPIGTGVNSMTGQVELRLLPPHDQRPIFVNVYGNAQGRTEANIHLGHHLSEKIQGLTMIHGNFRRLEVDMNDDGFLDAPLTERGNIVSSWEWADGNREAKFAVRAVDDRRRGGQLGILRGENSGATRKYMTDLNDRMYDLWAKHGWIFKDDPTKSLGLIFSARRHEVDNLIGDRRYTGVEHALYGNAIFQTLLGDGTDQLKIGVTALFDDFDEQWQDSTFARTETAPGAFLEHTLKNEKWALISSVRADYHQPFGMQVSPRVHFKYDFHPLTVMRVSGGKAYRSANPFVDKLSYLVSAREVHVTGPLGLEESWSGAFGFLHKWEWFNKKFAINLDLIRTEFTEQVVIDVEDPDRLDVYMLDGRSFSNSMLVDLQLGLNRRIDLKFAYRYYDAQTEFISGLKQNPLTPQHRGLIDLAYESIEPDWRFDMSYNIFGPARIPDSEGVFDLESTAYGRLNAQVTKTKGDLEIYLGAENMLGFQQNQQILGIDDPFGADFDASMIWGPVMGRNIYGGIRLMLGQVEHDADSKVKTKKQKSHNEKDHGHDHDH